MRQIQSLLLVACCAAIAQAQSSPAKPAAPAPNAPPLTAKSLADIHLGNSIAPLNGPWKFRVGDSPIDPATGKPLWAEPGFDDSGWETVDLTPHGGAIDPISGISDFVPGWGGKGHPGYWGYAWYRIRVKVDAKAGQSLSLEGPGNVDDAYQAFDDGALVGSFGDFSGKRPVVYFSKPAMFRLQREANDSTGSEQVIALRMWMEPSTLLEGITVGGMHDAPLLGETNAVAAQHQMRWVELIRAYILTPILAVGFGVLSLVAFSLILFDRTDRVYMWIGLVLLDISAYYICIALGSWTNWFGSISELFIEEVFLVPLFYAGWVIVWRSWFQIRRPTWTPWVLGVLVLLLMVSNALGENILVNMVSEQAAHRFYELSVAVRLLLAAMMLAMVGLGIRRQGWEGWLVLPATFFSAISGFENELRTLHINLRWFVLGTAISAFFVANLLLVVSIAVLLLRRLLTSTQRQRQMALDVKQAQEVQQVILPQARTTFQGLTIESEYRPAREVGGDFFQVVPHPKDGSVLIVAGDVTGKGLKAGMLVALLVGAIRSTAELNADPESLLRALNRRLMGRGDAQATCMALRIEDDGTTTLANAGHMPPYLNGHSLEVEGSLPLGMMDKPEFTVMRMVLKERDNLMLVSDGIVEATNAEGKLFGFERVQELVSTAKSAAEVARVAQNFGQEDDISVISITRTTVLEPSIA